MQGFYRYYEGKFKDFLKEHNTSICCLKEAHNDLYEQHFEVWKYNFQQISIT